MYTEGSLTIFTQKSVSWQKYLSSLIHTITQLVSQAIQPHPLIGGEACGTAVTATIDFGENLFIFDCFFSVFLNVLVRRKWSWWRWGKMELKNVEGIRLWKWFQLSNYSYFEVHWSRYKRFVMSGSWAVLRLSESRKINIFGQPQPHSSFYNYRRIISFISFTPFSYPHQYHFLITRTFKELGWNQ